MNSLQLGFLSELESFDELIGNGDTHASRVNCSNQLSSITIILWSRTRYRFVYACLRKIARLVNITEKFLERKDSSSLYTHKKGGFCVKFPEIVCGIISILRDSKSGKRRERLAFYFNDRIPCGVGNPWNIIPRSSRMFQTYSSSI